MDGEIILLVGQNGSGKTTFLDALRVLLNAPNLSKQRTLHHYIQKDVDVAMIRAVVTNQLVGNKRPFAHMGIYGDTDVSIICLIKNKGPKKLEKEFHIVKGQPSPEKICQLKGGLKPQQYSRYLEEAGVSRSTLKLIALEQGQTDKIGQLSPQDLLNLVMDITGNKDIIKRYEEARRNYRHTLQQLIELKTEYNKIVVQTQQLEKEAREAMDYKELLDEQGKIEKEKLPLSRWYEVLNQLHAKEKDFAQYQDRQVDFEKRIRIIREEQLQLKAKRELLQKEQEEIKKKQREEEKEINHLHQKIGQSHSEWKQLDAMRKACEEIPDDISLEQLQKKLDKEQEVYYQKKSELSQTEKFIRENKKELDSLKEKGLPTYPKDVYFFRDILHDNHIDNLLFAEGIEITDPQWQLAIEAFLGRERFSVFVSEQDFLKAKRLGEEHRYGFYISRYQSASLPKKIPANSILGNLNVLDDRISSRVTHLKDIMLVETVEDGHHYPRQVTITKKGYRQDQRGGIFIARNVRLYCGAMAAELQIEELETAIQEKLRGVGELYAKAENVNRKMREIKNQISLLKKKESWHSSQQRFQFLEEEGKELMKACDEKEAARSTLAQEQEKLALELSKNFTEYQNLDRECTKIEKEKQQVADNYIELEQNILQLRWRKEELEKNIPSHVRNGYVPENIEETKWLERKLRDLLHQIDLFRGCRDLEKIALFDHESGQLLKKKKQLTRQEIDQQQRERELEKCREDYQEMIIQTVSFYNKSVKELAALAGCRMRAFLTLGKGESMIEDARMEIRVAFDQKREVDIRDKSLSGGQDVIASLILLVALSRMEQKQASGFFILDEHNAHLDMIRIMEVGHFLRSTRAQFVLTTPTTENMATLAVSDLILTFTKKSAQTTFASKPRFIRRA